MFDQLNEYGPSDDPIVAEVRAARIVLFAAAGNDIQEFCRRARARQTASGHPIAVGVPESPDAVARVEDASRPSRNAD
jgi:hypothetical protein